MCDFISWIRVGKGENKKIYFLTDDMIIAKWGENCEFSDHVGHSAIESYYGNDLVGRGEHIESFTKIDPSIVKEANSGNMNKMLRAWNSACRTVKYNEKGVLIKVNGLSKEDVVVKKYRSNAPDKFKIGDKIILGRHLPAREEGKAWYDYAMTATPENGIQLEPGNWDRDMDAFVGSVAVVEGLEGNDQTGNPIVSVNSNDWMWQVGACRKATKQEIEAAEKDKNFRVNS